MCGQRELEEITDLDFTNIFEWVPHMCYLQAKPY